MRSYITASLLLGLASLSSAAPTLMSRSTIIDISGAVNGWASDTSQVSQFLSSAKGMSGEALQSRAQTILAVAQDEPLEKKKLDDLLAPDASVKAAGEILERPDVFKVVVDNLSNLANGGASMTPLEVAAQIDGINETRCKNVLPAIDTYFKVASEKLNNGVRALANRPNNCPT
ncbi:hypothetical protein GGR54DRAFT_606737 [Hypoxylon sp. NC1633]|nr:hypothetical protein GGR54DRAFT_606737 [Hypoxylon sp. NC1633]